MPKHTEQYELGSITLFIEIDAETNLILGFVSYKEADRYLNQNTGRIKKIIYDFESGETIMFNNPTPLQGSKKTGEFLTEILIGMINNGSEEEKEIALEFARSHNVGIASII